MGLGLLSLGELFFSLCGNQYDPLDCEHCLILLHVPINPLTAQFAACSSLGVTDNIGRWVNICCCEPNRAAGIHSLLQMNVLRINGCFRHDRVIVGEDRVMVDDETKSSIDMRIGAVWTHRTIFRLAIAPLLHS